MTRINFGIPLALGIFVTGTMGWYVIAQQQKQENLPTIVEPTGRPYITALGKLEPQSEVINLSVPAFLSNDRVATLLVKLGDRVNKGQVIAILDSQSRMGAAKGRAQQQVMVAEAKLSQIQAGAKVGEINAQTATIERLQAQLAGEKAEQQATLQRLTAEANNAQSELRRNQQLHSQGVISESLIDSKRLDVATAMANVNQARATQGRIIQTLEAQIAEAQATKNRIAEIRPVDVTVAQAELAEAKAALKQAERDFELTYIRAPIDGRILKIHSYPGELVESKGVVELGQTDRMLAVTEVYQSDIEHIKLGQLSTVTGEAFTGTLKGKVAEIGLQVNRQDILSAEPGENLDRRVVEVKVELNPEDSKKVVALTNLQVLVSIQPGKS